MKEVAERYGELLARIDKQWQETLHKTQAAGQPVPRG